MGKITVSGKAFGQVTAPPSKSMAHRLLICAYLSGGSTVHGLAESEDINATRDCLKALETGETLNCRESGSTLRFMIPLCLVKGTPFTLTGTKRLFSRSLEVYETLCKKQGIEYVSKEDSLYINGKLRGGEISVRGDISSQFISGLCFALPLVDTDSVITITNGFESVNYVDMTLQAMNTFGIDIRRCDNKIFIKGNQTYKKTEVTVEGDWSNAAFFDALNLLGSDVKVTNLDTESLQGDKIYREYYKLIENGCPVLDITNYPDLGPILMALGAACHGVTLTGTKRLAIKESDRGRVMAEELKKFGVRVTVEENRISVSGGINTPTECLFGHNDHRIVMALSVLLTVSGGSIEGFEAVAKSFPDFFERLESLGVKISYEA